MAQLMRPISTVTDQGNFTGATAHGSVDGTAPDTGDYWNGNDNQTDVLEVLLTDLSGSTPGSGTCTVSIYEAESDTDVAPASGGGSPTYDVEVYEGTTQIAARTGITATESTFTLDNNLTFAASSITDWSNVRVRFTSNGTGGSPSGRRGVAVSYIDISVPDAAVNTDVQANLEQLTLTTLAADISNDVSVGANTEALTLTTYQALVEGGGIDTDVQANLEQLTLTTYQADVAYDVNVSSSVEALTLTTLTAGISSDVDVQANTEQLTVTTYSATISKDVGVGANTEQLTLTTLPANVKPARYDTAVYGLNTYFDRDKDVITGIESLTLTTHQATVELLVTDTEVLANLEQLTLATYPASVSLDSDITANLEQLTLTTYPAEVAFDVDVQANTEQLTVTALQASVNLGIIVDTNLEQLTLTTYPVTIGRDVNVQTGVEQLTLSTISANVQNQGAAGPSIVGQVPDNIGIWVKRPGFERSQRTGLLRPFRKTMVGLQGKKK